jgi:putative transcriptional regulator
MKQLQLEPGKGRLLISEPFLNDDFFHRSVVLLAENSENGTMGFILNKPVGHNVHELINDFPEFESEVYFGGPVDNQSLFFIHTIPHLIGSSFEIGGGIHYGGDFEKLREMVSLAMVQPDQIRFFAGYSGWDAGQLDFEMKEDSWLVFERPPKLLEMKPENLWGELLRKTHSEKAIWSNYPEDPNLN